MVRFTGVCEGLRAGPVCDAPEADCMVVSGLKVTVRCGRCDVGDDVGWLGVVADWGRRGDVSVVLDAIENEQSGDQGVGTKVE